MRTTVRILGQVMLALTLSVLCAPACLAQADTWENLKIIQPGGKVYVKPLDESEAVQVSLLIGRSRARKAAYAGATTGATPGTLTGVPFLSSECCALSAAAAGAASDAFWGGVGAGIAALFPQHREVICSVGRTGSRAGKTKATHYRGSASDR